jgi:hypothetical protein
MGKHDFGWALNALRDGFQVDRTGWNGRGMYLKIQVQDANSANTRPYIWIRTAQGDRVPWVASHGDLLGEDWNIVEVGA